MAETEFVDEIDQMESLKRENRRLGLIKASRGIIKLDNARQGAQDAYIERKSAVDQEKKALDEGLGDLKRAWIVARNLHSRAGSALLELHGWIPHELSCTRDELRAEVFGLDRKVQARQKAVADTRVWLKSLRATKADKDDIQVARQQLVSVDESLAEDRLALRTAKAKMDKAEAAWDDALKAACKP